MVFSFSSPARSIEKSQFHHGRYCAYYPRHACATASTATTAKPGWQIRKDAGTTAATAATAAARKSGKIIYEGGAATTTSAAASRQVCIQK